MNNSLEHSNNNLDLAQEEISADLESTKDLVIDQKEGALEKKVDAMDTIEGLVLSPLAKKLQELLLIDDTLRNKYSLLLEAISNHSTSPSALNRNFGRLMKDFLQHAMNFDAIAQLAYGTDDLSSLGITIFDKIHARTNIQKSILELPELSQAMVSYIAYPLQQYTKKFQDIRKKISENPRNYSEYDISSTNLGSIYEDFLRTNPITGENLDGNKKVEKSAFFNNSVLDRIFVLTGSLRHDPSVGINLEERRTKRTGPDDIVVDEGRKKYYFWGDIIGERDIDIMLKNTPTELLLSGAVSDLLNSYIGIYFDDTQALRPEDKHYREQMNIWIQRLGLSPLVTGKPINEYELRDLEKQLNKKQGIGSKKSIESPAPDITGIEKQLLKDIDTIDANITDAIKHKKTLQENLRKAEIALGKEKGKVRVLISKQELVVTTEKEKLADLLTKEKDLKAKITAMESEVGAFNKTLIEIAGTTPINATLKTEIERQRDELIGKITTAETAVTDLKIEDQKKKVRQETSKKLAYDNGDYSSVTPSTDKPDMSTKEQLVTKNEKDIEATRKIISGFKQQRKEKERELTSLSRPEEHSGIPEDIYNELLKKADKKYNPYL